MRTMRRMLIGLVLLAAAALAVEPVIHTHPLTQGSHAAQCAVCVNAHAGVTTLAATPLSPLAVVGQVVVAGAVSGSAPLHTALASRAPPAV